MTSFEHFINPNEVTISEKMIMILKLFIIVFFVEITIYPGFRRGVYQYLKLRKFTKSER